MFLKNPPIIFLDEPTASLDVESRAKLTALMLQLKKEGKTLDEARRKMDSSVAAFIANLRLVKVGASATYVDFVAQNVKTLDFGDPVFPAYSLREMNGVPVAVIGQAFPYTPIANPRYLVPEWTFGNQEESLQQTIAEARAKGAKVVVLLSHNGMDVDLKLASRVTGLDAILGGHTHDGVPAPTRVGGTLVCNSGSNGKFLSVMDLQVSASGVTDFRYRLLPVFANLLPADAEMAKLISSTRKPFEEKLRERLAVTEGLLYRRGNFNGSWDQLILDALLEAFVGALQGDVGGIDEPIARGETEREVAEQQPQAHPHPAWQVGVAPEPGDQSQ